jgi:ribosomal protein S18 acetylase RimI-like enzyme
MPRMTGPPARMAGRSAERVTIRRAGRSDVHEIAQLWEAAGLTPSRRGFRNEIARLRRRDPELLLIGLAGGRMVGAIAGSFDGRTAVVSRLAVAPDARRRGVGTQLVSALCDALTALGAGADRLLVVDDREAAEPFWSSLGFSRGAATAAFVRGG